MEQQYGEIKCPEGLDVGAKLEDLPEKSQESYKKMQEMQEGRKKQIEEVSLILDNLEMISSEEGKELIDKLRGFISPNSKTPEKCVHGGKEMGEVNQECCGGRIDKKTAYVCGKHIITVDKKCATCKDFKSK